MARYGAVWLELARDYYDNLPAELQAQVDARLEQLLENPPTTLHGDGAHYDSPTDQWTATYGDGVGLIVFALVSQRQRLIVLRLV